MPDSSPRRRPKKPVRASAPTGAFPVILIRSWRPHTPEELGQVFAAWSAEDVRFRAVWDLLALEHEAALLALLNNPGGTEQTQRAIGELRAIVNLRARILELQGAKG